MQGEITAVLLIQMAISAAGEQVDILETILHLPGDFCLLLLGIIIAVLYIAVVRAAAGDKIIMERAALQLEALFSWMLAMIIAVPSMLRWSSNAGAIPLMGSAVLLRVHLFSWILD